MRIRILLNKSTLFCGLVYAGNCIKAARIAHIGQALGNNAKQKILVVANIHISPCVGNKLRFAVALRKQKAKCNHFPQPQIKTGAGVIIAEAVIGKPAVYMSRLPCFLHMLAEDCGLRRNSFFKATFRGGGCLTRQGKAYASCLKSGRGSLHKRKHTPIAEIIRTLINRFGYFNRRNSRVKCGGKHFGKGFFAAAAHKGSKNGNIAGFRFKLRRFLIGNLIEGKAVKAFIKFRIGVS